MVTIANELLQARIHPHGAELQSLYHKAHNIEYMWSGDPVWWGKYSPVLFPIVGQLRNNSYTWQGKAYTLPRHGFARDNTFIVESASDASAVFALHSSEATKAVYPFDFIFRLRYTLSGDTLAVSYEVTHTGDGDMLFSVGGHPAFAVPRIQGTAYEDYFIAFSKAETAPRWLINNGLIDAPSDLLQDATQLPLTQELFYKDALVFKHLQSQEISLLSRTTPHGLTMDISAFPYLGIWAAKDAPFVCLEPWQGIADAVDHNGLLEEKEGIIRLPAGETKSYSWQLKCF
jgi:galactose mutarotase-like enzyme